MFRKFLVAVSLSAILARPVSAAAYDHQSAHALHGQWLSAHDFERLTDLYRRLIDAENNHDIAAVKPLFWVSPDALFVAKTATAAEGNWAGFWGTDVVLQHLDELYRAGPFRIEPAYDREKIVALSRDVAETYVPVSITVAYGGQTATPKPFLMILEWVRTANGWRVATDIALPIPPAPHE